MIKELHKILVVPLVIEENWYLDEIICKHLFKRHALLMPNVLPTAYFSSGKVLEETEYCWILNTCTTFTRYIFQIFSSGLRYKQEVYMHTPKIPMFSIREKSILEIMKYSKFSKFIKFNNIKTILPNERKKYILHTCFCYSLLMCDAIWCQKRSKFLNSDE